MGERLERSEFELHTLNVVPGDRFHDPGMAVEFPDLTTLDLTVAMGATWSACDAEVASRVVPELDQLRRAPAHLLPTVHGSARTNLR